jgi:hypothetical protein
MAHTIEWDSEDKTLLWLRLYESLTWREYLEAFEQVAKEVRSTPHRVNVILRAEVHVPAGNPLQYFKRALKTLEALDNLNLFISVNPDTGLFARMMVETLTRVYVPRITGRVPFVATLDEAQRLIATRRARIPA